MKKLLLLLLVGALIGIALLPYLLFRQPDMPEGTDLQSPAFSYQEARLLIDRTAWHPETQTFVRQHEIFETMLREIKKAETFIIADFFLWNPWKGGVKGNRELRLLSVELADAFIQKRIQNPEMPILIVTDPINRVYGNLAPDFYNRMADAGIPVVFTELAYLPESNRMYASQLWFWSKFIDFEKGLIGAKPFLPNLFDANGRKLTLSQYLSLFHFKANHRKVLVAGRRACSGTTCL